MRKKKKLGIVEYLGLGTAASLVLSLAFFFITAWFDAAVWMVYLCIVLASLDAWSAWRRLGVMWPSLITIFLFGVLVWFMGYIVYRPAPLRVDVSDLGETIPDNNGRVEGLDWRSEYYQVRVNIINESDDDYTNVDGIVFTGDLPFGAVKEIHGNPTCYATSQVVSEGVSFVDEYGRTRNKTVEVGGTYEWRLYCDKIRKNDMITLLTPTVPKMSTEGRFANPAKPKWVGLRLDYHSFLNRPNHFEQKFEPLNRGLGAHILGKSDSAK
jgi:hypothetical protein